MSSSSVWSTIASIWTVLIPNFMLKACGMSAPEQQQAWRQKILLFSIMLLSCGAFIGILVVGRIQLCSEPLMYNAATIKLVGNSASANGKVISFSALTDPSKKSILAPFAGQDVSSVFPIFTLLGRTDTNNYIDSDITQCVGNRVANADRWLSTRLNDTGFKKVNSKLVNCPLPNGAPSVCFYSAADQQEIQSADVADFGYSKLDVAKRSDVLNSNVFVIVKNHVYDLGRFLNVATDGSKPRSDTNFFSEQASSALLASAGGDATSALAALGSEGADVTKCLDKLFLIGSLQNNVYQGCALIDPVTYIIGGLIFLILFAKIIFGYFGTLFTSCGMCAVDSTADANVLVMVSCYAEPEDVLQKALESIACLEYPDERKMMIVVCDGLVQIKHSDIHTHTAVLDILGYQGGEPTSRSYQSIGQGVRSYNEAKCYSGTFRHGKRNLPYLVISKTGTSREQQRPGSRGLRDSHLLLLNFLSKARNSDSMMSPLEYEMFYRFSAVLGYDPRSFEYMMMLNSNTVIEPDSLSKMTSAMDSQPKTVLVFGESRSSNPFDSPATMLQSYPNYLRNQLGLHFASMTGTLTSVSSSFALHRLRTMDGESCVLSQELIHDYSYGYSSAQSMHMSNVLYKGEDMVFPQLVKKYVPCAGIKSLSSARAHIELPTGFVRMWENQKALWNATFHTQFEILSSGSFSFWTRFWVFWDVVAMLTIPAVICSLISLIYSYVSTPYMVSAGFVAFAILGLAALDMLLLVFSGRFSFLILVPLYLIIGVVLFHVILPIAAFWTSDSNMCVDDFAAESDKTSRVHGCIDTNLYLNPLDRLHVPAYTIAEWNSNFDGNQMANEDVYASQKEHYVEKDLPKTLPREVREIEPVQNQVPYIDQQQRNGNNYSTGTLDSYKQPVVGAMYEAALPAPPPIFIQESRDMRPYSMAHTETDLRYDDGLLSRPGSVFSHISPSFSRPESMATKKALPLPPLQLPVPPARRTIVSQASRNNSRPGSNIQLRPTNFGEPKRKSTRKSQLRESVSATEDSLGMSFAPERAQSMARSDYMSDYNTSYGDRYSRRSMASRGTMGSMYGSLDDDALMELAGGLTKEEVKNEIHVLLQDADLNSITRREVKEHLYVQLGVAVDYYHEWINICIENFTLEKLALL